MARFQAYIDTQKRFAKIAADAGATVVLSNHSEFDEGYMKARMMCRGGEGAADGG